MGITVWKKDARHDIVGDMADHPDILFCGFSLWIDQRQFPDTTDFWDSNWLLIRARMEASGARIDCGGPILMTADIRHFRDKLAAMIDTLRGEAILKGLEPELDLELRINKRGHVEATIEITPDHLNQHHRFTIETDQTYLPDLLRSCDAILERFPVINEDEKG